MNEFADKCNHESVALEKLELPEDVQFLQDTLKEFIMKTESSLAQHILDNWQEKKKHFVKVCFRPGVLRYDKFPELTITMFNFLGTERPIFQKSDASRKCTTHQK